MERGRVLLWKFVVHLGMIGADTARHGQVVNRLVCLGVRPHMGHHDNVGPCAHRQVPFAVARD